MGSPSKFMRGPTKGGLIFQIVIPAKAGIHPTVDTGLRRYDEVKWARILMGKYPALLVISGFMRVVGWILVAIAALLLLITLILAMSQNNNPFASLSAGLTLFSALSAAIYGIIIMAIGETILVLIDIEQNTRGGSRVSATIYSTDAALSGGEQLPPPPLTAERARRELELRKYDIKRFVFGSKHEVRLPSGATRTFSNESAFLEWARAELRGNDEGGASG
jgi:hypothetical protein